MAPRPALLRSLLKRRPPASSSSSHLHSQAHAAYHLSSLPHNNVGADLTFPPFLHSTSLSSQPLLSSLYNSRSSALGSAAQFQLSFLSPHSCLSRVRSAQHHIPLSGATLLGSTRSPLFLSSPSSLLSQSATPFYCPRYVDPTGIPGNICVHDVAPGRAQSHEVCQWRPVVETVSGVGSLNWSTVQEQDPTALRENLTAQGSGWSSQEVFNAPNIISLGRLFSGPFLAWLISQGLSQPALIGLLFAGASDWLDGYIARRKGIDSIVGTYLDPLADKVLICCVTLSMAQAGYLHPALVALVISRDAALVGGTFIYRAWSVSWKWTSVKDFFNIAEGAMQRIKPLFISKGFLSS